MRLTTLAKVVNMALGASMIIYSVLTIFTIALSALDSSPIIVISFRIYEV